ncbi:MAG TPA: polyprenol monophosphomannose synthase [Acidimicrobiia bacterium]|nr:polyprenol monophosphomannose synthase [Acidimicrobiia bacterium]
MRVLVLLPTYNEIENIDDVLRRTRAALPDADVIVIDDGSPDGTADRAEKLDVELGGIEVLRRPSKSGLGSAYRAGFRVGLARGYDVMIEMDADLSHDPSVLPELVAAIEAGADLAIGSRYVRGGSIPDWKWLRRAISRGGSLYSRILLGLSVHDVTAGFRAYHRRVLGAIPLDSVRADGYGFQVEMTYLTQRYGGRIVEIPITFRDRTLGHSKMSARIVVEALVLVTWWGVRDRVRRLSRPRSGARD